MSLGKVKEKTNGTAQLRDEEGTTWNILLLSTESKNKLRRILNMCGKAFVRMRLKTNLKNGETTNKFSRLKLKSNEETGEVVSLYVQGSKEHWRKNGGRSKAEAR